MAFNWFRRQFNRSEEVPEPQVEPQEAEPAQETPLATAEDTQEDYLAWAKAAYQNIQQRQQTPAVSDEPVEEPSEQAAEATSVPEETLALEETPVAEVIEVIEETDRETNFSSSPLPETSSSPELADEPQSVSEESDSQPAVADEAEKTEAVEDGSPDAAVADEAVAQDSETAETEPLSPEIAPQPSDQSDPSEATQSLEPSSAVSAETAEQSVPIWARADADRQARLERLKATAIDDPPATLSSAPPSSPASPSIAQPSQRPSESASLSETELDEGFLWSAEVLAAQGRRPEDVSVDEITWLQKLRQGLGKTRRGVVNQLKTIVGRGPLTAESVSEIEALLLQADVGVSATDTIIEALEQRMLQETLPPDEAIAYLKKILRDILDAPLQSAYSPTFTPQKDTLNVWLLTGVNGAGKTTTIGKLAHVAKESGYVCLIAAADTFRAAAVEQVKVWAGRSGIEVISNPGQNTDPAAVVFDAIAAAQARNTELLLVDTAGRLQNKKNLMDELRKVRQVIDKKAPNAKVESLLVLDATLGQNGLRQAQVFSEAAQLSGVVLTKLDGTAKGGVALAVVQQLGLPIRFIGAGEGITDLRPFSSYEFVEALLSG